MATFNRSTCAGFSLCARTVARQGAPQQKKELGFQSARADKR
jgi:hypothetical protein